MTRRIRPGASRRRHPQAAKYSGGHESITRLIPGVCVDIPLGTAFQYRCTGTVPLVFTCTALPPWPGDAEAVIVDGPWVPLVDPEPAGKRSD